MAIDDTEIWPFAFVGHAVEDVVPSSTQGNVAYKATAQVWISILGMQVAQAREFTATCDGPQADELLTVRRAVREAHTAAQDFVAQINGRGL